VNIWESFEAVIIDGLEEEKIKQQDKKQRKHLKC